MFRFIQLFFFFQQPPQWARAVLIHELSGSHTQRRTTLVGPLWTSDQLVAETST